MTVRKRFAAIDARSRPEDFARPGHVFPLRTRPDGILERRGHTEAAVDLAQLSGLHPSCVICEVLNEDGTMARGEEQQGRNSANPVQVRGRELPKTSLI